MVAVRELSSTEREDLPRMSLMEHLEELRRRILWSLVALGGAFFLCWGYAQEIFQFLAQPVYRVLPPGKKLAILGITDAFILYVKVAALAAAFLAAPFILLQVWKFVAPGLYRRERYWALPFVVLGSFFFVGGGAFAYYVAFPFAVQFLLGVGQEFEAVITVERYFGFLLTVVLGLGLMFELPILIFLLSQIGIVTPRFLMRNFRWAVLIIFFVAAIITPTPDIVNMLVFAVPTIVLYLLGVAAAALVGRQRKKPAT